jgi:phosphoribosylformylglycinamidine synthase
MSGTFNKINVPPTLISFAVCTNDANKIISPELKSQNSTLVLLSPKLNDEFIPNAESLKLN